MKPDLELFRRLEQLNHSRLYGEEMQKILPYRKVLFELYPSLQYRPAAVLALLYPKDNRIHTVFIKRNTYDGVHSGQIAFPGGKKEKQDKNLQETALREAREELNINPANVQIIRSLTPVKVPVSSFEVTPYLGITDIRPDFVPDPAEVQAFLEIPLEFLLNEPWHTEIKRFDDKQYPVLYLPFKGHRIWGATAIVIAELRDLLKQLKYF